MLHLIRRNTCLRQRQRHRPPRPAAIFRPGGQVIGVSAGAITDQFRQRCRTTSQGMLKGFDHQQARALAHDKTVTPAVERPRRALRGVVVTARECPRCRKTGQTDAVDAGFRAATHSNVRFAGADQARRIANRLNTRGARRHRRTQRPLEAVLNGYVTCREIDQKRRNGKR